MGWKIRFKKYSGIGTFEVKIELDQNLSREDNGVLTEETW